MNKKFNEIKKIIHEKANKDWKQYVGPTVAAGALATGTALAIKNVIGRHKKKNWVLNGCDSIQNPNEQAKCKKYTTCIKTYHNSSLCDRIFSGSNSVRMF